MKFNCYYIIHFILIIYYQLFNVNAQESNSAKTYSLSGYISDMQSLNRSNLSKQWILENTLHNRLNFEWNPFQFLTVSLQVRNRLISGDMVESGPEYSKSFKLDKGLTDLTWNLANGNSYFLNTQFDRANISFKATKFTITAGRQRINWGQTFAWNPNDIFNSYSYFDFDYPERPGSDALRFEYFTGYASGLEFAVKTDSSHKITSAALLKLNKWNYDFQFLGGVYESNELVFGAGWSGNIKKFGFYGEMSYFRGISGIQKNESFYFTSVALNYIFTNSLNLQSEILYSYNPEGFSYNSFTDMLNRPLSVKTMAFSEFSFLLQAGYPFNPLLTGNISWMWMPSINGHYFGPNLLYSLGNNLETSLAFQYFKVGIKDSSNDNSSTQTFIIGLLRVKFSF